MEEFLDHLQIEFSSHGVPFQEVGSEEIKAAKRETHPAAKRLRRAGVSAGDICQIMAAVSAEADDLVTRDRDFVDPRGKRQRKAKRNYSAVKARLETDLGLMVLWPAEAVLELLDQKSRPRR